MDPQRPAAARGSEVNRHTATTASHSDGAPAVSLARTTYNSAADLCLFPLPIFCLALFLLPSFLSLPFAVPASETHIHRPSTYFPPKSQCRLPGEFETCFSSSLCSVLTWHPEATRPSEDQVTLLQPSVVLVPFSTQPAARQDAYNGEL